jgi:predicted small integral membrane protein
VQWAGTLDTIKLLLAYTAAVESALRSGQPKVGPLCLAVGLVIGMLFAAVISGAIIWLVAKLNLGLSVDSLEPVCARP